MAFPFENVKINILQPTSHSLYCNPSHKINILYTSFNQKKPLNKPKPPPQMRVFVGNYNPEPTSIFNHRHNFLATKQNPKKKTTNPPQTTKPSPSHAIIHPNSFLFYIFGAFAFLDWECSKNSRRI